ncbi:MAG TPA: hypothetical protein VGF67_23640 [Ktedonobacteraceae bacterium]|jgi:hypothetical protein
MGYTHSWGWAQALPYSERFPLWSIDVAQLLACYQQNPPPNPWSEEPWFKVRPDLIGTWDITICGPFGFDLPIIRPDFVAFNGNRASENNCESFLIDACSLSHGHLSTCKTWGKPYDLLATAALIRFKHYFPAVAIHCGGGVEGLDDAAHLCRVAFGQGRNPLRDAAYCRHVDRFFEVRSA